MKHIKHIRIMGKGRAAVFGCRNRQDTESHLHDCAPQNEM